MDNFITVTVNRDQAAKEEINKAKEDFYTKYSYLKPECEKDFIEKVVDTVESAADWCCEHWKLIVTIVIVVVAVALLWTGVGGVLLAGACWGALSVFTGGMTGTMKCFIAGTLIATETGFAGIESIKPGDLVLSTNADTMHTGYKKVLEKYVRKTKKLVHIIAGGEKIVSTPDHPYYVAGRGFVNACQLCIGSPLLDADGRVLETEQIYKEYLEEDEEVTVYNFQVEDWHTYHVGEMEVLVHNAEYEW